LEPCIAENKNEFIDKELRFSLILMTPSWMNLLFLLFLVSFNRELNLLRIDIQTENGVLKFRLIETGDIS